MTTRRDRFTPKRLLDTLKNHSCDGRLLVALSGGADSTALLVAAANIRDNLGSDLQAIHINHHVHDDSDLWQKHCQALCEQLGIPLANFDITTPPQPGESIEAELRDRRYLVFEEVLQDGDLLLMAHHQDDQAETLLLNLMRGSGIDGVAGIPRQRTLGKGQIVRPLLNWPRSALTTYLESEGIGWLEDSSNQDTRFDRNFIRQRVIPTLTERWPSAAASMATSAAHAREASYLLAKQASSLLRENLANPLVLNLNPALVSDTAMMKLLIRRWVVQSGAPAIPGARLAEFCRQVISAQAGSCSELSWQGWQIRHFNQRLWLLEGEYLPLEASHWNGEGALPLGNAAGELHFVGNPGALLNCTLTVRSKLAGETIALNDEAPARKVKELLRVAGVPPWLRDQVPVMLLGNKVVAIGDWIIGDELREIMNQSQCELAWRPKDPCLVLVHLETG